MTASNRPAARGSPARGWTVGVGTGVFVGVGDGVGVRGWCGRRDRHGSWRSGAGVGAGAAVGVGEGTGAATGAATVAGTAVGVGAAVGVGIAGAARAISAVAVGTESGVSAGAGAGASATVRPRRLRPASMIAVSARTTSLTCASPFSLRILGRQRSPLPLSASAGPFARSVYHARRGSVAPSTLAQAHSWLVTALAAPSRSQIPSSTRLLQLRQSPHDGRGSLCGSSRRPALPLAHRRPILVRRAVATSIC